MNFLDRQLRAFLLGQLPAAEREAIEARAFEDDDFAAQIEEAQADLLDDWARHQLPPAEAALVVERFPLHQRQLAQSLAAKALPKPKRPIIMPLALAASLLLAAFLWNRPTPEAPKPPVAPIATIAWTINAGVTRGAALPTFQPPSKPSRVLLSVPAPDAAHSYRAVLESPGRGQIFTLSGLRPQEGRIAIPLDPAPAPGDYDLLLYVDQQLSATFAFRVQY